MEIILIRHFMTRGNQNHRYIGTTDEPLLKGQAWESAGTDRSCAAGYPDVQAVAVSPLKRCVETANIIYPCVRRVVCSDLRECDFGLFENKSYEELKDNPDYQRWIKSGGTLSFPGGEARDVFCERSVRGFVSVTERFLKENVRSAAFVVHGGTIMAILDRFAHHEEGFYHWQVRNREGYRAKLNKEQWQSGVRRLTEIERL